MPKGRKLNPIEPKYCANVDCGKPLTEKQIRQGRKYCCFRHGINYSFGRQALSKNSKV